MNIDAIFLNKIIAYQKNNSISNTTMYFKNIHVTKWDLYHTRKFVSTCKNKFMKPSHQLAIEEKFYDYIILDLHQDSKLNLELFFGLRILDMDLDLTWTLELEFEKGPTLRSRS